MTNYETKDSWSGRVMRLMPVFIIGAHNQTNNECLLKVTQTDNAPPPLVCVNFNDRHHFSQTMSVSYFLVIGHRTDEENFLGHASSN